MPQSVKHVLKKKARNSPPATAAAVVLTEIVIGSIVSLIALFAFAELARNIASTSFIHFDNAVSTMIQAQRTPLLTQIMIFISFLGADFILLSSPFVFFWFVYKKHQHQAILFALILFIGFVLNIALKYLIARARPDVAPLIKEQFYSFPSGHSMGSFVFYALLGYFAYYFTRNKLLSILLGVFFFVLVLTIGVSRVYLGVHYPTDVIGGFIMGFCWFMTAMLINTSLRWFREQQALKKVSGK